jgi:hypothetical protein
MIWWFVLYWPIMGAVIFIGHQVAKRYPSDSVERNRADLALGCVVIGMSGIPLLVAIGSLVIRNPTDPIILSIESFVGFWIALALFFGGLARFPWMRKAVAAIKNALRTSMPTPMGEGVGGRAKTKTKSEP